MILAYRIEQIYDQDGWSIGEKIADIKYFKTKEAFYTYTKSRRHDVWEIVETIE